MDKRLGDILNHREGNHLLPFLWMREGHRKELPALIQQVYDSGARAFCVESRTHEGFCRQSWWDDMDVVMKEAEARDMKVWLLDDKRCPTGYANGLVAEKYPHLRKWQLAETHVDMVGPAREQALLVQHDEENIIVGVYAYRRTEEAEVLSPEYVDLTGAVKGNYVYWDVPAGVWRVMTLYKTRRGTWRTEYMHLIEAESVHVLIEAVYEPHFARYGRHFGKTFAGFFSDEPSLGNCQTAGGAGDVSILNQRLGQPGLALPWTDELLARLNESAGADVRGRLAGLWYEQGTGTADMRLAYMDVLTDLWRRHFSYQLGDWCRSHGVEYIGHIIEDKNAHARLGCSGGHYFRSLEGQDMAGIDVVLHQIMPGLAHYQHTMFSFSSRGVSDPEFYQYVLARLATSLGHIQPHMKNRAMCEIFGAYGWAEGVPMMKHLMDHMLVRGINYFVPHAFSPDYPDDDCPPHFNGGGCNPEFSAFAKLMNYTNKVTHLLEGGREIVSAAVLYHAEGEWSGRDYMLTQKPAKRLYDAQLNYDILPIDAILNETRVEDGMLRVNEMRYPALIVPYAAKLPEAFLERAAALEREGARIAFLEGRPEGCSWGDVIALDGIEAYVRSTGGTDLQLDRTFPLLRFLHVLRDGCDIFMLVNESMEEEFDGEVRLPVAGHGVRLNLLEDARFAVLAENGRLAISLGRGESTILFFGDDAWKELSEAPVYAGRKPLECAWTLTLKPAHGESGGSTRKIDVLYNVAGPEGDDGFSGWMIYKAAFDASGDERALDLGLVGECAHAWLNGVDLGLRIDAPYVFDITGAVREGKNELTVEVTNSLVHQQPDRFSSYVPIGPSGLLGPVSVLY